ncbi:uncharacterized protein EI97DRAFT_460845 [Westerdykella ornata]|uniref:Uncharacterized protein n=1 Tax=Westerdykella ornata TaxID=318751 RepID=A0A6A6JBM4_WESOR|nr:uncharacterized protein EI97DRAFT_460845 [Westerdykella ornata]KAF2273657.1 hypothetical protein EI97DRAFT_460845 [Westerdykella ornata]
MGFRTTKIDFESFAARWPDPDPAYANYEPDPDRVPLPGKLKDPRLSKHTREALKQEWLAHNPYVKRDPRTPTKPKYSQDLVGDTPETRAPANVDTGSESCKREDNHVISDRNIVAVDLSKGWPAPTVREYGPPMSVPSPASNNGFFQRSPASNGDNSSTELLRKSPSPSLSISSIEVLRGSPSPKSQVSYAGRLDEKLNEISMTRTHAFERFRASQEVIGWQQQVPSSVKVTISELMTMNNGEFRELHDNVKATYEQFRLQRDERDFREWYANWQHEQQDKGAATPAIPANGHTVRDDITRHGAVGQDEDWSDEQDGYGSEGGVVLNGRSGWNW